MSTEERMKILEMISAGKITTEEGARLLDAAIPEAPATPVKAVTGARGSALSNTTRRLRVKVVEDNGTRVNVNLPLSLMQIGLRIGGRFVDELKDIEDEMEMLMEAINNDVTGKIVEVDDDGTHVEVYIE